MTDAVEQYSLSVPDRLPDHSLLAATIVLSKWADIPAPDGQSVELQSEPDSDADSGRFLMMQILFNRCSQPWRE